MERLTYEKSRNRWDEGKNPTKYTSRHTFQEVVARLAAYEDAMPVERAQELAQAEKDGRLVVLPCKVGDMVYEANKRGFISIYKVTSIHIISYCSVFVNWKLIDGIYSNLNGFDVSELGKTVFLTREEAEAALKERGVE